MDTELENRVVSGCFSCGFFGGYWDSNEHIPAGFVRVAIFFIMINHVLNLKNSDCLFLMHLLTLLINIHKYANEEFFAYDHISVALDLEFNLTPFGMTLYEK